MQTKIDWHGLNYTVRVDVLYGQSLLALEQLEMFLTPLMIVIVCAPFLDGGRKQKRFKFHNDKVIFNPCIK